MRMGIWLRPARPRSTRSKGPTASAIEVARQWPGPCGRPRSGRPPGILLLDRAVGQRDHPLGHVQGHLPGHLVGQVRRSRERPAARRWPRTACRCRCGRASVWRNRPSCSVVGIWPTYSSRSGAGPAASVSGRVKRQDFAADLRASRHLLVLGPGHRRLDHLQPFAVQPDVAGGLLDLELDAHPTAIVGLARIERQLELVFTGYDRSIQAQARRRLTGERRPRGRGRLHAARAGRRKDQDEEEVFHGRLAPQICHGPVAAAPLIMRRGRRHRRRRPGTRSR